MVRASSRDGYGSDDDETFEDIDKQLMDYFTFKAVKTVLQQLLEMNPSQYSFLYNFTVENRVTDGATYIRTLVKERQELGERVMITRVDLFTRWKKRYTHASLHASIKDQNLLLLREHLLQTVKFQPEDSAAPPPSSSSESSSPDPVL